MIKNEYDKLEGIVSPLDILFVETKALQPKPNENLLKVKHRLKYKSANNYITYPFKPLSKLIIPDDLK